MNCKILRLLSLCTLVAFYSCASFKKNTNVYRPTAINKSTHKADNQSKKRVIKRSEKILTKKVDVTRTNIVKSAEQYLGVAYSYGGKKPNGFDCSGLISYVFDIHGIKVQGSSRDQSKMGKNKPLEKAETGDLIFFESKGEIVHVSIVAEKSQNKLWVLHSTSSRGVVKDEILQSSYWQPKIATVRDVID